MYNTNLKSYENFNDYLRNILLESNKLTYREIGDLVEECLKWTKINTMQATRTKTGMLQSS